MTKWCVGADSDDFRYRNELMPLVESSNVSISRHDHVEGSNGLRKAADQLCFELSGSPEAACCLWVAENDLVEYRLFENPESNAVLGCLRFDKSRDNRDKRDQSQFENSMVVPVGTALAFRDPDFYTRDVGFGFGHGDN